MLLPLATMFSALAWAETFEYQTKSRRLRDDYDGPYLFIVYSDRTELTGLGWFVFVGIPIIFVFLCIVCCLCCCGCSYFCFRKEKVIVQTPAPTTIQMHHHHGNSLDSSNTAMSNPDLLPQQLMGNTQMMPSGTLRQAGIAESVAGQ